MRTLPSSFYLDSESFAVERREIFQSAWWPMCPSHLVSEPGSYFSDSICGWPVFVLRGNDGSLRAFRNVCRHRGAGLLEHGCGKTGRIVCPYHGWTYAHDGRLLNAPKFGDDLEHSKDELGLRDIDLHEWNGLIFVKMEKGESMTFQQWLGDVGALCEDFPGPNDLNYHGEFAVRGEVNWKLYCENTVEGYHLHSVHERLGKAVTRGHINLYSVNDERAVVFDVDYGAVGDGAELRSGKGLWVYCFPGFQMVLGDHLFKAERVEPDSVRTIRSLNWSWFGGLSKSERDDAFEWAKTIVNEDLGICSSVYRNMKAGNFEPGPLSPAMETHVAAFQARIRRYLEAGT